MKENKKLFNLSYLSLYLFFVVMILFERIYVIHTMVSISLYRIILLPLSFFIFLDLIHKKRFIIPRYVFPFVITYSVMMFIGLQWRNTGVLIGRLILFYTFLITYNIFIITDFNKEFKMKLTFVITIMLFIASITMLSDYFHITKFIKYLKPEAYKDFVKVGRPSSILGAETNFTAARFGALIPFLFYYVFNEKKNVLRLAFALFTLLITIIAQLLTASRMGYITLAITLIIIFFYIMTKLDIKAILITILVLILLSSVAFQVIRYQLNNSSLSWRMRNMENFLNGKGNFNKGETSLTVRFILFFAGLDMIKHHPLLGVGVGNSKYKALDYINEGYGMRYLHNTFLSLGSENGLLPMILFITLFAAVFIKSIKLASNENFWLFFSISMAVQFINFFFLSDILNRVFWSILMPIGNLALLKSNE